MTHQWLPIGKVNWWTRLAARLGVSEVARSGRGFLAAYRRAGGNPNRLSDYWYFHREGFVARHMAQARKNREPFWLGELPTRRHLALIMWAYSPTASRV